MANLLSVEEAQNRILAGFQTLEAEMLPIGQCANRILAEDITAPDDLPPFANSGMDGFAVQSTDVRAATNSAPILLEVVGDIRAGIMPEFVLLPGQAARIMTGAPLPAGADSVVPVEDTNFSPQATGSGAIEGDSRRVAIHKPAYPGNNIRPQGMDIRKGTVLLRAGRTLMPQDIGMIASTGRPVARVYRKPRVALFSSGDELVPPGQPLSPGQIYDSNQYVLAALLEAEGVEVIRLGTAPDDPQKISSLLDRAVRERVDLIVTSAGVSVGAFDYVRQVIEEHGSLDFWKVNMRPGKPVAFGSYSGIPLLGLPGNPVSAYVCCRVFVLPVVYRLGGRASIFPRRAKAYLTHPIDSDGRESYLRAIITDQGRRLEATLTGHQGSGNLYSLVQANALLIVPSGVKSLPLDSEVEIWFLESV